MGRPEVPLSSILPPLVCGTATFNSQYNADPYALPTTGIVHRALDLGVRAFDTSPYYGPAEELLGRALATPYVEDNFPRESYYILTKVGRIAASSFDYSPSWVRKSVARSLQRFHTSYLDVVYCHDVEFVTPEEVLGAVRELRRIRDEEGTIKYIGISGYPVDILCDLSEMILRETGEPLDIVQSYANYTLQNTLLLSKGIPRLAAAGVDVVPNASPLGMGLLRRSGIPIGSMGDFHPAPAGLRQAVRNASDWTDARGERLEVVAIRFALETWLKEGRQLGGLGAPLASKNPRELSVGSVGVGEKLGVSVMGVSNLQELDETLRVWHSILDGLAGPDSLDCEEVPEIPPSFTPVDGVSDHEWSAHRQARIRTLAKGIQEILGEWADYTWASPDKDFVNQHVPEKALEQGLAVPPAMPASVALLTPPLEAEDALSVAGDDVMLPQAAI